MRRTSMCAQSRTGWRPALILAGVLVLASAVGCGGGGQAATPATFGTQPTTPSGPSTQPKAGTRPPTGFVPASASFPTPADGFAWGIYPCAQDPKAFCDGLAATSDGGATWKLRDAPSPTPIDPYQRAELRFADTSNGWAALHGLESTHDGAQSWHPVTLPGLAHPNTLDIEVGLGFVYVLANSTPTSALRLYRSPMEFDAFTAVAGVSLAAPGANVHLSFADDGSGYLMADSLAGTSSPLYATADGSHWTTRTSPCPDHTRSAVAAGSNRTVSVICDGAATATGAAKSVWVSTDAGATFTVAGSPASVGFTADMALAPAPLATVSPTAGPFGSESGSGSLTLVVAASAIEDRLYISDNSGRSWTVAYTNSSDGTGAALGLADLAFSDGTHGAVILGNAGVFAKDRLSGGHAVLAPRLLFTADTGRHWIQNVIR